MIEEIAGVLTTGLAWAAAVAAISGIIHGYTGFGGALVMVPLLALLFGPVEAIAVTSFAALVGSAQAFPRAARAAVWREVGPLAAALLVATPLGVAILLNVDPEWIRRVIGACVLLAALLIMSGWVYRGARNALTSAIAGTACGAITGAAGVGGPPVVVYFLAAPQPAEVQRANILISVSVVVVISLTSLAIGGGIDVQTVTRGIILSPLYMAGFWAGARLFAIAPAELYRRIALWLLIATGLSVMIL